MSKCLLDCDKCEELIIERIDMGLRLKIRLAHLGIIHGTRIMKTRQAPLNGPVELRVKGTRIIIGHGIAEKIMVRCPDSEVLH